MLSPRQRVSTLGVALLLVACPTEPDVPSPYEFVVTELPVTTCAERGDGSYVEVAASLGIDFEAPPPEDPLETDFDHVMGGGVAAVDVTGDALPDLVFTAVWGRNAVYRNDGDGGFVRCENTGLEDGDRTYAVSAVDLDDDGLREVVLLDATAVRLFHNEGDCTFTERDPIHRVTNPRRRPMNAAWADYNRDGLLDVYVAVRDSDPLPAEQSQPAPDVLLRGEGDLRFRDVSVQLGAAAGRSGQAFASGWLDVDQDGDLDHYVANDHGAEIVPNVLFLREGTDDAPTFREAGEELGLDVGINSMGLAIGDVDGDGWDEVGVSDTANFVLLSTRPVGPAVDVTTAWGLQPRAIEALASWAMELADVDHDRDLDLLVSWGWKEYDRPDANRDDLWEWDGDGFVDRGDRLGFEGHATGRTVVPVDLDGDGSLEIVATALIGAPSIQKAPCPDGRWLEVGVAWPSSPEGLGAVVEIEAGGVVQRRRLGVGSTGVHSAREPVAHFGLGSADDAEVRVVLPSGEVVALGAQSASRRLRVLISPTSGT